MRAIVFGNADLSAMRGHYKTPVLQYSVRFSTGNYQRVKCAVVFRQCGLLYSGLHKVRKYLYLVRQKVFLMIWLVGLPAAHVER